MDTRLLRREMARVASCEPEEGERLARRLQKRWKRAAAHAARECTERDEQEIMIVRAKPEPFPPLSETTTREGSGFALTIMMVLSAAGRI